MEQKELQKLLLETIVCSIACDGDIDDREIEEMHKMINHASYFREFKVDDLLDEMIQSVRSDGRAFLGSYFKQLKQSELSPMQELLVLEVVLRIIRADEKLDENEIAFLKLVRSSFNVHDEIIQQRFGDVPCLADRGNLKERYRLNASNQEEMDALAGKIEQITAHKDNFDSIIAKFDKEAVELDVE